MLPPSTLPQLALARAQALRGRLQRMLWIPAATVAVEAGPSRDRPTTPAALGTASWTPITIGHACGGTWDYQWIRLTLDHPAQPGEWLRFEHGGEGTAWIDGAVWAGFDVPHPVQALPLGTTCVLMHLLCSKPGRTLAACAVQRRDEAAWNAFHDLDVLVEAAEEEVRVIAERFGQPMPFAFCHRPALDRVKPEVRRLLRRLDEACDAFDRGGVVALQPVLTAIYAEFPADAQRLAVRATGHSHLDLVWLWPEHATAFKATHTFSSMLRLMDAYPEFRFGFSQPPAYAMVGDHAPAVLRQVQARMREGRWEAEGALLVESDSHLPCGEALNRCFEYGQQAFTALTGRPSTIAWLPDAFGFSAVLPMLCAAHGVTAFYTTKLHWNPVTFFPHTSFRWVGSDGSEVLAHQSTHAMGYILDARVKQMRDIEELHRQGDVHNDAIAPLGHGDGGGGTTMEQCERMRRLDRLRFCPPSRWGSIRDFTNGLEAVRDRLPAWHGELYLEYHRGTFTTQGSVKAASRAAERGLQAEEAARCAVGLTGDADRTRWERVIFAQFHDLLPGSAIGSVYREAVPELEGHAAAARRAAATLLGGPGALRFNPLALPWHGVIDNVAVSLPPLTAAVPTPVAGPLPIATARRLDNGRVVAELDDQGHLVSLVIDGKPVRLVGPAARLCLHREHPTMFEAWDIDRPAMSNGAWCDAFESISASTSGGAAEIVVTRRLGHASRVVLTYRIETGSPVLRLDIDLDWQDPQSLLRLHLPTAYRSTLARFGLPFGSIQRPQVISTPATDAMYEVPTSRWAAVADDGERDGLWLASEAKYGFTCRDGDLSISLVRSPLAPDRDTELPPAPGPAADPWAHACTDIARHRIRLAIGRHDTAGDSVWQAAACAETLFTEPVACATAASVGFHGLIGEAGLVPCWARSAANGSIIRLHEVLGRHGSAQVCLAPGLGWSAVDLAGKTLPLPADGLLHWRPQQVLGLRIHPTPVSLSKA